MCNGFPCKCCRPVVKFDTHFDEPKPWKCFFQDMQAENPIDQTKMQAVAPGIGNIEFSYAFMSDYGFPGARPIQKACADSFYTAPTFHYPGGSISVAKAILARMQFDQPNPEEWKPQRIKIRVHYDYQIPYPTEANSFVPTNNIAVILGDENDDPLVEYTTSYPAWPAIMFRVEQGRSNPSSGYINCNLLSPEGGFSYGFSGFKMPGTFVGVPNVDITKTGHFELTVERLTSSTRFRLEYNDVVVGLTSTTIAAATEWLEIPVVLFRESPRWRLLVGGMQLTSTSNSRVPAKFDRIAAESSML